MEYIPELLTINEIVEAYHVARPTIYTWIRENKFISPVLHNERQYYFSKKDVEFYFNNFQECYKKMKIYNIKKSNDNCDRLIISKERAKK